MEDNAVFVHRGSYECFEFEKLSKNPTDEEIEDYLMVIYADIELCFSNELLNIWRLMMKINKDFKKIQAH